MMTSSGITTLQCNPNIARSLSDCTIQQGICSDSVVAAIACGSSVITGKPYDIYVIRTIVMFLL